MLCDLTDSILYLDVLYCKNVALHTVSSQLLLYLAVLLTLCASLGHLLYKGLMPFLSKNYYYAWSSNIVVFLVLTVGFVTVNSTKKFTHQTLAFYLTVNLNSDASEIHSCLHWAPYLLNLREAKVFQKNLSLLTIFCESAWSLWRQSLQWSREWHRLGFSHQRLKIDSSVGRDFLNQIFRQILWKWIRKTFKRFAQLDSVDRTFSVSTVLVGYLRKFMPGNIFPFFRRTINGSLLNRSGILSCSFLHIIPSKAIDCCWIVCGSDPITSLPYQCRVLQVASYSTEIMETAIFL